MKIKKNHVAIKGKFLTNQRGIFWKKNPNGIPKKTPWTTSDEIPKKNP